MLAIMNPAEAYRQSNFDARIKGSDQQDIVLFCIDELLSSLATLQLVDRTRDPAVRSNALTRGVTALTALELGVDRNAELARSLLDFFGGAKTTLLDMVRTFDPAQIAVMQDDFREVRGALQAAARQAG